MSVRTTCSNCRTESPLELPPGWVEFWLATTPLGDGAPVTTSKVGDSVLCDVCASNVESVEVTFIVAEVCDECIAREFFDEPEGDGTLPEVTS